MTNSPGLRAVGPPHDEQLRQAVEAFVGSSLGERAVELTRLFRFGTGHSGDTYRATLRSSTYTGDVVMRLSPAGVRIAGPADVGRQGRILGALYDAGLPAPTVLAMDSTGAINGRSIAVMSLVVGDEWHEFADRHSHDATAAAAVSSLKAIQTLPLSQTGISGEQPFGPAGEIDRWVPLLERSPASIQDDGMALHAALHGALARSDPGAAPVLVHGDYHFGNLLFGEDSVVAVFDWEIAGLGHPLADLGCLAVAALRRRYEPEPNPTGSVEVSVGRLAELYGADLDVTSWHVASSCFKYAAILGYNLQLSRRGRLNEPIYEKLQNTMAGLLGDGHAMLADGVHGI